MYHKTSIERLSPAQISKLVRGQRIRVKHGHGHEVHLSSEQHKKLHAAHRRGAGITLEFDPYQQQMHQGRGDGFLSSALSVGKQLGKTVAPVLLDEGVSALKKYIAGHGEGEGEGRSRRHKSARGGRLAYSAPEVRAQRSLLSSLGHGEGEGMHFSHRGHGEGEGEGVHRAPARRRAPVHKGRGEGLRKYHAKKRGGALRPAGYGEGDIGEEIGRFLGKAFLPF